MQATQYIWQNGKMIAWENAMTHVLCHGLHYGSGVFEGIRCYETQSGPAVFQLQAHTDRLLYSSDSLGLKVPYTAEEINQAIIETVAINQLQSCYIRPLVYYGYGSMKVCPPRDLPVEMIIAAWPWGQYLPGNSVDIKTSDLIRIHPQSTVADAKIAGHYVNTLLAGLALHGSDYHEALFLDFEGYVAEGGAANIFIVKKGEIYTPPTGTILKGITRNTIIELARDMGIVVHEKKLKVTDIYQADEAFFSGTAVEIMPIRSLDNQVILDGQPGSITQQLQALYQRVIRGQEPRYASMLSYVKGAK